ncbi:MAG: DUF2281 domain-containing protein [Microcystaceae cyanobacterium]
MTVLEIAIQKMQYLPQQKQQEVLDFIEFLALKSSTESSEMIPDNGTQEKVSCYDLTKQWIGIGDDLPSDLSVNKNYLQDYGK